MSGGGVARCAQYIDLVLDTGDIVRVEVDERDYDAVIDAMNGAMKRRDEWPKEGVGYIAHSVDLNGLEMDRVNMARVVGRL